ncbi:unnamed protein product, partial [Didymodactylos carnosus]
MNITSAYFINMTDQLNNVYNGHNGQNGHSSKDVDVDNDEKYIFAPEILKTVFKLFSTKDSKLNGNVYDSKYLLRPLSYDDYDHNYIEVLRQLTECGVITREQFVKRFNEMKQCPDTYYVLILEDLHTNLIIGTATFVCERKFIRQLGLRGRIEDVVIDNTYRGQNLGKLLIEILTTLSSLRGCYKISLECKDHLVKFYQQFGYNHEDK